MKELTLLAMLAGSLLAGALFRAVSDRYASAVRAEPVAARFEAFALRVLLPIFVYEALSAAGLTMRSLAAVLAGAVLPLSCLLVARLFVPRGLASNTTTSRVHEIAFLAASFGGGNRGTALLLLVFAGTANFNDYLHAFVLVDLGNFLVLLTVVPMLLPRFLGTARDGATQTWGHLASRSYFATGVLLVAACYLVAAQWAGWGLWLADTAAARKAMFSVLVFFALGVRIPRHATGALLSRPQDLVVFAVIRVIAAAGVLSTLWLLQVSIYVITATGILFMMPPSSLLPVLATRAGVRPESLSFLAAFSVVCNLLFLVALVGTGLVIWISQTSQGAGH